MLICRFSHNGIARSSWCDCGKQALYNEEDRNTAKYNNVGKKRTLGRTSHTEILFSTLKVIFQKYLVEMFMRCISMDLY